MVKSLLLILTLIITPSIYGQNSSFISAKDHKRKQPLGEALIAGASGVSIEIKLDKNGSWNSSIDWEKVYLKPLQQQFERVTAPSNTESKPFLILINVKGDSSKTFEALNKTLAPYASILTQFSPLKTDIKPIVVWVHGDIPYNEASYASATRYFFPVRPLLNNLSTNSKVVGVYIDFDEHYKWNGKEFMPNMQYHGLQTAIKMAKKQSLIVLAEDCPETDNAWTILKNSGVDYFIVSDFDKYKKYLQNR